MEILLNVTTPYHKGNHLEVSGLASKREKMQWHNT
jgi:hypothetical protein